MIDTTDQFAQLTPKTIVRFPNLSGAIVEVGSLREDRLIGETRLVFGARCDGCLETYENGHYMANIHHPRTCPASARAERPVGRETSYVRRHRIRQRPRPPRH
jgi:hypothetical protein